MSEVIEIRLRKVGDSRPWGDLESLLARVEDTVLANRMANAFLVAPVWEVRWNIKGYSQGHYLGADSVKEAEGATK